MSSDILARDQNHITVIGAITDDSNQFVKMIKVDPVTGRVLASITGVGSGTVTSITAGTGLTGGVITTTGTIALANTAVTPASYTNANITVDQQGRITSASNGSAGSGTVTSVSVVSANGFAGTVANASTTPAITLSTSITGVLQGNGTAISAATTTGSGNIVLATSPTVTLGTASTAVTQTPADNSTKVATTAYVDAAVLGQNFKEAVKYATTAALPASTYNNGASGVGATLTEVGLGAVVIDGATPSVNDRILIKNQASTFQNGIYTVTVVGNAGVAFILTRSTDANQTGEWKTGDSVFTTAGTANSTTTWAYTGIDSPVMGTDALTFVQTAGQGSFTAGNGIAITGNSIAIDTTVVARKSDNLSVFAATTSAQLAGVLSDETGSGAAVFGTNPTITKPVMSATNPTAQTYSPAGAGTATLDLSLSNQHDITMPAGNITIALSNDTNNQMFSVSILQDATGSRTVTWFTTIRWAGGTAPNLTTTASKRDTFLFKRTGSGTYDGYVTGMNI